MSIPTVVFLDTSVLAGQQFNFSSTAIRTFIPAAQKAGVKLALPDPTEREIKRQIKERSQEALDALELARKRAPFLAKWSSFPRKSLRTADTWEVTRVAMDELREFLSQFSVDRLDYDLLDIRAVMTWYDGIYAPFQEGKKRKEFPDAFAISMLDTYAEKNECFVAVVSEDRDFRLACERFPRLLYFKSLPRLTELLLSSEEDTGKLRGAIEANVGELEAAVASQIEWVNWRHQDRRFDIDRTKTSFPEIYDLNIVAIGEGECAVTFEVGLESQHLLSWEEYDGPDEPPDRRDEWVIQTDHFSGSAKLSFDPQDSTLAHVPHVSIDAEEIDVSATPRRW